jgi:parallel beta-helix repeat protein
LILETGKGPMQFRSVATTVVLAALTSTCSGDPPRPPAAPSPAPAPLSIQTALDAAVPGATIIVPAGTYREALRITTSGVTLKGEGNVVLDGEAFPDSTPTAGVLIQAADVTVSGLTILRFHRGIASDAARCRITNNYVGHGRAPNTAAPAIGIELVSRQWWRQGASDCEVTGNTIRGVNGIGIHVGGDRNIIRGNTIADVERSAGILIVSANDSQIVGNTVSRSVVGILLGHGGNPKEAPTNRNLVAENQSSGNVEFGVGVSGWYTRENRLERNRASDNRVIDLYMRPEECGRIVDNVWRENQGSRNCPTIQ